MVSYLIKSVICSGLLFAVYHFLLEREKMLRFNRFFLLSAMAFALLVPLATIEMPSGIATKLPEQVISEKQVLPPITVPATGHSSRPVPIPESTGVFDHLPWLIYGLIASALLLRTCFQIGVILRAKSRHRTVPFQNAKLVLMPGDTPTYTFFRSIFIPQQAFDNHSIPDEILTHELAHARQMHSLDILFTELLITLCWFNPLLLLYRRAIRLNHEYLADDAVLAGRTDVNEYQLLLLDTLIASRTTTLASSFNYPFTKKRLAMMTRNINPRIQFVKKVLVAALLPMLAFVVAEKTYSQQPVSKPAANAERKSDNVPASGKEGVSEEEMREFMTIIEKHTRPTKSKKERIFPIVSLTSEQENEIYAVYERMSDAQKEQVKSKKISIFKMEPPVRNTPSPEMFENWKKPSVFGIWLNEKHVPNSELNKYKNTDIAEYTLHRLVGAGLVGKGYKYQLNLTTQEEFDRTFEDRMKNRIVLVRLIRSEPAKGKAGSKK